MVNDNNVKNIGQVSFDHLRGMMLTLVDATNILTQQGSNAWRFTVTFPGFANTQQTFASRNEAVEALIGALYGHVRSAAA
jgi:hypothetical protein